MNTGTENNKIKLIFFIAIGLISLLFSIANAPLNTIFFNGNRLESGTYGMTYYDNSAVSLFSLTPLNDYYYIGSYKEHVFNDLKGSNNGNIITKFFQTLKRIGMGGNSIIWDTKGVNTKGNSSENYTVTKYSDSLEIQRDIEIASKFDGIGETIKFCNDCIITDDKKRAYFNSETVQPWDVVTATSLGYVPIIIGENQLFLPDAKLIKIIGRSGKLRMEISVSGEHILLQNRWKLLEFVTRMPSTNKYELKQNIKIYY